MRDDCRVRPTAILFMLGVLLLIAAVPAAAFAAPSVSVSPKRVPRGGTLVVTGKGWPRNVRVQLLIGPPRSEADHVAWARTGGAGTFRRSITIGARARTGPAVLLACRRECRDKASVTFRIFAPALTG